MSYEKIGLIDFTGEAEGMFGTFFEDYYRWRTSGKWVLEVFKPLPEEEAALWREYMEEPIRCGNDINAIRKTQSEN